MSDKVCNFSRHVLFLDGKEFGEYSRGLKFTQTAKIYYKCISRVDVNSGEVIYENVMQRAN
jgi:hypothetical protein